MDAFGEFIFQKLVTNQLFGLEFRVVRQDTIYSHQDYEQVKLYENRVLVSLVGPSAPGISQLIYNWLKIGTFQPKFDKIYFFYHNSQPLYNVMQNEIKNL